MYFEVKTTGIRIEFLARYVYFHRSIYIVAFGLFCLIESQIVRRLDEASSLYLAGYSEVGSLKREQLVVDSSELMFILASGR